VVPVVPDDYAGPVHVGNLGLHREPVVIRGRTVRLNGGTTEPVVGATVTVTGMWRMLATALESVPPEEPKVVSLQPPLYFDRADDDAEFRQRTLVPPPPGEEKRLLAPVRRGSDRLRLSDRVNLAPGDLLSIDAGDPERNETLILADVPTTADADLPVTVTTSYRVQYAHRRAAVALKVTTSGLGLPNHLAEDAIAGDTCVFLKDLVALAAPTVVQVSGGGGPLEYHQLYPFSVTSGAGGYYRLPLLSRVAQVRVQASSGALAAEAEISVDYGRENRLDFVLEP
jgi:hypothetical protein